MPLPFSYLCSLKDEADFFHLQSMEGTSDSIVSPKRPASSSSQHSIKRPKLSNADAVRLQIDKLHKPWEFETSFLPSTPPDINLRPLLAYDEKDISDLLKDHEMEPKERCLQYDRHEVWVEQNLLARYYNWAKSMRDLAEQDGDQQRMEFFSGVLKEVTFDYAQVCHEYTQLGREQGRRRQQREALGLPGGRAWIRKGTRCYWDYIEKGFYYWEEGEWKREEDGRRREWDKEVECWQYFRKVEGKWVVVEKGN